MNSIIRRCVAVLAVLGLSSVTAFSELDRKAREEIDVIRKGLNQQGQIIDLLVLDDATFGDDVAVTGDAAVTGSTSLSTLSASGAVSIGGLVTLKGTSTNVITTAAGLLDGEAIAVDTIDDDSIDFGDVTGADLTLSDCVNIGLTGTFSVDGTNLLVAAEIDGEKIAVDTIDDDSIDFTDVTAADLTFTEGCITDSTIVSDDIKNQTISVDDLAYDVTMSTVLVTNNQIIAPGVASDLMASLSATVACTNVFVYNPPASDVGRTFTLMNGSTNVISIQKGSTIIGPGPEWILSNQYDNIVLTQVDNDHFIVTSTQIVAP